MNVGHRQRRADDPGQVRDVADLLETLIAAQVAHHRRVGVHDAVDPHAARFRQPPAVGIDLLDVHASDVEHHVGRPAAVGLPHVQAVIGDALDEHLDDVAVGLCGFAMNPAAELPSAVRPVDVNLRSLD